MSEYIEFVDDEKIMVVCPECGGQKTFCQDYSSFGEHRQREVPCNRCEATGTIEFNCQYYDNECRIKEICMKQGWCGCYQGE